MLWQHATIIPVVQDAKGMVKKKKGYYSFPTDQDTASKWVHFCRRKDDFTQNKSNICSEHFTEEDFERDLQSELLGLQKRRKLKPTAIPTVYVLAQITEEPPEPQQSASKSRSTRNEDRNIRKTGRGLLKKFRNCHQ